MRIEMNETEGGCGVTVSRKEVTQLAATAVAYHLADDESQQHARIVAPETDTDAELLSLLWRTATGELAALLPECVSSQNEEREVTEVREESGTGSGILLALGEISEGRAHLVGEAATAYLAARMAVGWLRTVNRLEAAALLQDAERAGESLRTLLEVAAPAHTSEGGESGESGESGNNGDAAGGEGEQAPPAPTDLRLNMSVF